MTNKDAIDKLISLVYGIITRDKVDKNCLEVVNFLREREPKPPVWKERIVPVFEEYEDGTGAIKSQNWSDWFCPTCGGLVSERYWIPGREPHDQHRCNYCPKCGQAIDWENDERKDRE